MSNLLFSPSNGNTYSRAIVLKQQSIHFLAEKTHQCIEIIRYFLAKFNFPLIGHYAYTSRVLHISRNLSVQQKASPLSKKGEIPSSVSNTSLQCKSLKRLCNDTVLLKNDPAAYSKDLEKTLQYLNSEVTIQDLEPNEVWPPLRKLVLNLSTNISLSQASKAGILADILNFATINHEDCMSQEFQTIKHQESWKLVDEIFKNTSTYNLNYWSNLSGSTVYLKWEKARKKFVSWCRTYAKLAMFKEEKFPFSKKINLLEHILQFAKESITDQVELISLLKRIISPLPQSALRREDAVKHKKFIKDVLQFIYQHALDNDQFHLLISCKENWLRLSLLRFVHPLCDNQGCLNQIYDLSMYPQQRDVAKLCANEVHEALIPHANKSLLEKIALHHPQSERGKCKWRNLVYRQLDHYYWNAQWNTQIEGKKWLF